MQRTYTLNVAGVTRELQVCDIGGGKAIAAFILFGDVELTKACAKALYEKLPEFDLILTAEAKAIPLAHELSAISGKKYFVARKRAKVYMPNPVFVQVNSITTEGDQLLCLDASELDIMNGKKLLIVDDVISSGGSLAALNALAEKSTANVVARAAVLAEGEAARRNDIIFLEKLPILSSN